MVTTMSSLSQSYCNIIDHISHSVCYIPVAYLLYNWKFVPLNPLHLFLPPPVLLPFWQPPA